MRVMLFLALRLVSAMLPLLLIAPVPSAAQGVRLRSIGADAAAGVARAVIVEEGALVHTALMLPEDGEGRLQGEGNIRAQAIRVLENLDLALREARTTLDALVRLHVYVASAAVTPQIDALVAERFRGRENPPAVTLVESAMARSGALVAMDAVAATAWTAEPGTPVRVAAPALPRTGRASHAAVQASGPFVIVSGRAARGELEPAIRETMAQLRGDLQAAGLTFDHVVHVKSFVRDMDRAERVQQIVAEFFPGDNVPPQVVTEWRQDAVPSEIELIATSPHAADARSGPDHLEPIAGRYSRVARVHGGRPVFISALHGRSADPAAQVDEMFAELQRILQEAGSDLRHLVKATYYVADTAADERINAIRPKIFDPQHPPAASKLAVRGTGRAGKASTFDVIAVTR